MSLRIIIADDEAVIRMGLRTMLEERGYQVVERHCATAAMREEALDQVRQAGEMRWQYMSGLYRAFVLKEDG